MCERPPATSAHGSSARLHRPSTGRPVLEENLRSRRLRGGAPTTIRRLRQRPRATADLNHCSAGRHPVPAEVIPTGDILELETSDHAVRVDTDLERRLVVGGPIGPRRSSDDTSYRPEQGYVCGMRALPDELEEQQRIARDSAALLGLPERIARSRYLIKQPKARTTRTRRIAASAPPTP